MQSSIPSRKFAPALPRRKSRINVIGPATRAYLASLGRAQDRADSLRPPLPSQMFKPALCIAASLSAASGFVVTAPVRGENLHASPPRPHLVACTAGAHLPAAAPGLAALESRRASAWRCGLTPSACSPADPSSPTVNTHPPLPPPSPRSAGRAGDARVEREHGDRARGRDDPRQHGQHHRSQRRRLWWLLHPDYWPRHALGGHCAARRPRRGLSAQLRRSGAGAGSLGQAGAGKGVGRLMGRFSSRAEASRVDVHMRILTTGI